jgi:rod shape-determining protein MreD
VIADAAKAGVLLLFAALVQVSIASTIEVAEGHPNVLLVLVVTLALLRGPIFGACAGFWAGLVIDVASLGTLGLTSLLLTLAGHFAGRF